MTISFLKTSDTETGNAKDEHTHCHTIPIDRQENLGNTYMENFRVTQQPFSFSFQILTVSPEWQVTGEPLHFFMMAFLFVEQCCTSFHVSPFLIWHMIASCISKVKSVSQNQHVFMVVFLHNNNSNVTSCLPAEYWCQVRAIPARFHDGLSFLHKAKSLPPL